MGNKVIVEIYFTHGKGDGEHVGDRWVGEDSRLLRAEALENTGYDDLEDSEEDFLSGKIDNMGFHRYGGDWDEPTGGYIHISKKDELIKSIKRDAEREIKSVENMFKY